jgi:hypothetical protein
MSMSETRSYPRSMVCNGAVIEFRHMTQADEPAVLDFARRLSVYDLLFLPRNISEPKVLAAWIKEIERGAIISLLAIKSEAMPVGNQTRRMVETSLEAVALCGASLLSGAFAPVPSPSERGFLNSSPQAEPSVQISRTGLPR